MVQVCQMCQKENGLGFQNNENIDRKMVQVFKILKIRVSLVLPSQTNFETFSNLVQLDFTKILTSF